MAQYNLSLGNAPVNILCNGATVTNFGPGIVYYSDSQNLTAAAFDGTLDTGQFAELGGTQYFITSASRTLILVDREARQNVFVTQDGELVTEDGEEADVGTGIQGPEGPPGQPGQTGVQGPEGPQGPQGGEGVQGAQGDQGDPGQDGNSFEYRGDWDAGTAYNIADVVRYAADGFTSFIAVEASTGVTPADASDEWDGIVIQGPVGPAGVQGIQGSQGNVGPQGIQGPAGSTVSNALAGAKGRFYSVVSAVLRNQDNVDYWQPLEDATNRATSVDSVASDATKVTVDFSTLEATRIGSFVATPDDVLAQAGIRLAVKPGITATEISFLRSLSLSDFLSWSGSAWVRDKGSGSPFTVTGLTNTSADFPAMVLATANLTAFYRLTEPSGATLADTSLAGVTGGAVVGSVSYSQTGALLGDPADKAIKTTGVSTSDITLPGGAITQAAFSLLWIGKLAAASTVVLRDHTTTIGTGYSVSSSGGGTPTVVYRMGSSGATYTTTFPWATLIDGESHSILMTKNGTAVAFYIDGALVHSANTGSSVAIQNTWHFGRNGLTTPYVENTVDEVAFFARDLTSTEAANLHKTAFASGVLSIAHADIGDADSVLSLVPQGGTYRVVVRNDADGLTSTGLQVEFYDAITGEKALAADSAMRFAVGRSTANAVVDPRTITLAAFPNADVSIYGLLEVPQPVIAEPPPATPPDPTPLPDGGISGDDARVVPLAAYRSTFFDPDSFWNRELPSDPTDRDALIFQHATQPLANSANWVASLCTQMGFDPATNPATPLPDYLPGHLDGMAYLGREGHHLYIVPPDQPYRDISVTNPDNTPATLTYSVRLQALIDRLGGLPVPYDVTPQNNGDGYIHVYKPDEDLYCELYGCGKLDFATTTMALTGSPSSGSFLMSVTYGDQFVSTATYVTGQIAYNATAAQVKAKIDAATNVGNSTLAAGNAGKCVVTGGPLNVAPVLLTFPIANPLQAVFCQVTLNGLSAGTVGYTHHNAGPIDRIRAGAIIADTGTHPGISAHPGAYRDWTDGGVYLEDANWGGDAIGVAFMAGCPSYDEYQDALDNETDLAHALTFIVANGQQTPIGRVQPGTRGGDGTKLNNPGYIAEGARIALPPDLDTTYWETTYPEWMPIIRTMMTRGCIAHDKSNTGGYFVFRRASWAGSTFNPWYDLLPLYAQYGSQANHRYMRAVPWHLCQIIDPAFSAP